MSYVIGPRPPRLICDDPLRNAGSGSLRRMNMMISRGFFYMAKLLVVDNYDSFTYNLVQMFMHYDLDIRVHRSDGITLDQARALCPDYLLISPGPKDPAHSGISIPLILSFYTKIPVLGVCLGMQCINEAFGGKTVRAPVPVHGKTSPVRHGNHGIFKDVPSPFTCARYHSLATEVTSDDLTVTAETEDGVVMGLAHKTAPLFGVQFHPESFLTTHGFRLIENFLKCGPLAHTLT